ncbi:adenosylcobinamide amidohydrolase [Halospeciosus flavus]|uniref:Adenosylcobinamide amidohydrolase n=1 Tax=Halospeciosus flavus TaxID=3032283 RepID=A0ABD5Z2R9_9EURY|nr:adenosylcobinamide amidohydrolase [Halospeciosus flavus]
MFETEVRDGVCRLHRAETRWLSTGWSGGFVDADVAYNVTVPEGWDRRDLDAYVDERLAVSGFDEDGPVLLTGVDQSHARRARCGPVEAVATAGVSNPAALPMDPDGGSLPHDRERVEGTVNVLVGTTRALDDAALANLVAVAAEAKAATLLDAVGFPGTTTDAVVAGCNPSGDPSHFSGSATRVGAAARACVRETVRASVESRYADGDAEIPASVGDAEYGVSTDVRAELLEISE